MYRIFSQLSLKFIQITILSFSLNAAEVKPSIELSNTLSILFHICYVPLVFYSANPIACHVS